AKGLHRAAVDRGAGVFDHRAYRPLLLEGKTACVVGAGGIGLDVGKLCAALGMRVVGTRRHPHPDRLLPPGFSELCGAGDLDRFLPESDFVVICCQWTPETTRLFDKDRFAAMKAGGVLINVARGEIVDEEALADALQRDHLRGAALDVYVGEFEHTPMSRLWSDPRVLITPHISSASDQDGNGAINLFCDNLRAYLEGGPLRNVIDWSRGYEKLAGATILGSNARLADHTVIDGGRAWRQPFAGAPPALYYSAAAAILAGRKAGMTSFANRSRSSSWTSRGVPSGVAHTTRSTPG